ncbi:MAG: pyridoxamine 5'-phosphate oxidase family protein [Hyphomicrobiaceae bacterium]
MSKVTTLEELAALYGQPSEAAIIKEIDHISDHYRAFIDVSPFVIIATSGPDGLDCSPRGDPAGFVRVVDSKTVLIPDRLGNNRIDTLRNLIQDPRCALLFLIPGVGNTLRINGTAEILNDPQLNESFAFKGKQPRSVMKVTADRVYFQCPKALVRSRLWDPQTQIERSALPSTGEMLEALQKTFDGAAYDAAYPKRLEETIY